MASDARVERDLSFKNIFRRFADLLVGDAQLKEAVTTWRTWEGGDVSHIPPELGELTWVRLTPHGAGQSWHSTGVLAVPMVVHVETMTESNDVGQSMDLWQMMLDVMLSRQFADEMAALGVDRVTPSHGVYGQKPHFHRWEPALAGAVYADGDVELLVYTKRG